MWATIIVGIIGIIVAIIIYKKGLIQIEPVLLFNHRIDIQRLNKENNKLKLLYNNINVENVTTTIFTFLNAGKKPIKKEDIPTTDGLIIELTSDEGNVEILDYAVKKVSRESSNFKLIPLKEKNKVKIDFDFIDYKQKAKFEVMHTGTDKVKIIVKDIFLGPKKKLTILSEREDKLKANKEANNIIFLIICLPFILAYLLFNQVFKWISYSGDIALLVKIILSYLFPMIIFIYFFPKINDIK
jgi:hypothetical protein